MPSATRDGFLRLRLVSRVQITKEIPLACVMRSLAVESMPRGRRPSSLRRIVTRRSYICCDRRRKNIRRFKSHAKARPVFAPPEGFFWA